MRYPRRIKSLRHDSLKSLTDQFKISPERVVRHIFQIYPQLVLHDHIDIIPFRSIDLLQQFILIAVADRCQVCYAGTDIEHMHLFGAIGTLLFIIGFCAAGWIGIDKLICLSQGIRARLVTDNPYFYISLVCMILGTQLFLAGFVAELVSRSATDRNVYLIEKEI